MEIKVPTKVKPTCLQLESTVSYALNHSSGLELNFTFSGKLFQSVQRKIVSWLTYSWNRTLFFPSIYNFFLNEIICSVDVCPSRLPSMKVVNILILSTIMFTGPSIRTVTWWICNDF